VPFPAIKVAVISYYQPLSSPRRALGQTVT